MQDLHIDIDAVVTWVDGTSDGHEQCYTRALADGKNVSIKTLPSGYSQARYKNNNEIEYCLRGIRKYMPWIRHVFLVTDQQAPRFLNKTERDALRITMVDHRDIFRGFDWALPTFNSRSIETALHRIPGIAERYVYFNDDFIPVAPSCISDFFTSGKVVLRGKWEPQKKHAGNSLLMTALALRLLSAVTKKDRSAHLLAQMKAARLAGFHEAYIHYPHAPHPIRTETLREFFRKNPELFQSNIKYKFRNLSQFVSHPLAHHLEAATGNYVFSETEDHVTINFGKPEEVESAMVSMHNPRVKFICVQSLELASDLHQRQIHRFLRDRTMDRSLHSESDATRC